MPILEAQAFLQSVLSNSYNVQQRILYMAQLSENELQWDRSYSTISLETSIRGAREFAGS